MADELIKRVRAFNRYYTVWLDVMNKGYLGTDFSWPESRVLFEIYGAFEISATELCRRLNMDKSYISRILAKFEKNGLITRSVIHGRKGMKKICLTDIGREKAAQIDVRADEQMAEKLKGLEAEKRAMLCKAVGMVEKILRENDEENSGNGYAGEVKSDANRNCSGVSL